MELWYEPTPLGAMRTGDCHVSPPSSDRQKTRCGPVPFTRAARPSA